MSGPVIYVGLTLRLQRISTQATNITCISCNLERLFCIETVPMCLMLFPPQMFWCHQRYVINRHYVSVHKGQYLVPVLYEDLLDFAAILHASSNNDHDLAQFDYQG